MVYNLDTESEWSDKVSITTLGTWHYLRATGDTYLLTILGEDGFEWAGHPKDAPWERLNGHEWVVHNYSHEDLVWDRLEELGHKPAHVQPSATHCTGDLASYLGHPRDLKGAVKGLLGVDISKEVRAEMKGKKWAEMTPEFKARVIEYGLDDVRYSMRLWTEHSHKWP